MPLCENTKTSVLQNITQIKSLTLNHKRVLYFYSINLVVYQEVTNQQKPNPASDDIIVIHTCVISFSSQYCSQALVAAFDTNKQLTVSLPSQVQNLVMGTWGFAVLMFFDATNKISICVVAVISNVPMSPSLVFEIK